LRWEARPVPPRATCSTAPCIGSCRRPFRTGRSWSTLTGCLLFGLLIGIAEERFAVGIGALSEDLPIVVEIVDAPETIEAFLPDLDGMVTEGLVNVERAQVILYRGPDTQRS
jgi:hypothetical protein